MAHTAPICIQAELEAQERLQVRIQAHAQYVSDTTGWWDLVDTARLAAEATTNYETATNEADADVDATPAPDAQTAIEEDDTDEEQDEEPGETLPEEDAGAQKVSSELGNRNGELWSEDVFENLLLFLDVTTIGHCFWVCCYWAAASGACSPRHRIWEQLCKRIYPGMLGRGGRQVQEYLDVEETRIRRELSLTKKWRTWKQMFVQRARVRTNGVYLLRYESIKQPVRDMWTTLGQDEVGGVQMIFYRCFCFSESGTLRYATLHTKSAEECVWRFEHPDHTMGTSLAASKQLAHGLYSVNSKGEVRTTVQLPHAVVNFGLQLDVSKTEGVSDENAFASSGLAIIYTPACMQRFHVMELREHWSLCHNERTEHKVVRGQTTCMAGFCPFRGVDSRRGTAAAAAALLAAQRS